MNTIRVTWNKLEEHEKQLVVGLFNNSCFPLAGNEGNRGVPVLWCQCNIDHPCQRDEDSDQAIWDAMASIEDGKLRLDGNSGPGGQRPQRSIVLPEDVEMDIGASVGM